MSQLFKNNAKSRLAATIDDVATSFTVTSGEGSLFPVLPLMDDHMLITLENSTGDKEVVRVVQRGGDTFTIGKFTAGVPEESVEGRAQDGTTAMSFEAQDLVELRLTAGFIDALKEGSIVFVIDGGGSAISTGLKGWIEAPFNGTIKSARLFGPGDDPLSGSLVTRVYKSSYANNPFTEGVDEDEIMSNDLSIDTGQCKAEFINLTPVGSAWPQRNFLKGDILIFDIESNAGNFTRLTISLTVDRY